MKIDVHTHILPEKWPDLKQKYGYGGWVRLEHHKPCCARMMVDDKFFREIEDNCWNPETRIKESGIHGIDVQVLSTVPVMFNYWAKPEHTADLSKLLNDHISDVCVKYPDRYIGLGTIPMQHPDLAIKELERIMKDGIMQGIQIGSNINDINLDDPTLFPIFEAAQDLGASIFVHPWEMMGRDKMSKYWLPWLVGMPAETSRAICSLIFGGVLERLPNLKFCFAHGGGSFPSTIGRISHGFEVRPDLCAIDNDKHPTSYLNKIYLDSLVHTPEMLKFITNQVGFDRVMIGSDYPFPLGEDVPGTLIHQCGFDEDQIEHLSYKSAIKFLGLSAENQLKLGLTPDQIVQV